jgi:hypothetical protein
MMSRKIGPLRSMTYGTNASRFEILQDLVGAALIVAETWLTETTHLDNKDRWPPRPQNAIPSPKPGPNAKQDGDS